MHCSISSLILELIKGLKHDIYIRFIIYGNAISVTQFVHMHVTGNNNIIIVSAAVTDSMLKPDPVNMLDQGDWEIDGFPCLTPFLSIKNKLFCDVTTIRFIGP